MGSTRKLLKNSSMTVYLKQVKCGAGEHRPPLSCSKHFCHDAPTRETNADVLLNPGTHFMHIRRNFQEYCCSHRLTASDCGPQQICSGIEYRLAADSITPPILQQIPASYMHFSAGLPASWPLLLTLDFGKPSILLRVTFPTNLLLNPRALQFNTEVRETRVFDDSFLNVSARSITNTRAAPSCRLSNHKGLSENCDLCPLTAVCHSNRGFSL